MPEVRKTSISNVKTFDIEATRYRRFFDIESRNFDIDAVRYRRNFDIEVHFRRYRQMHLRYLDTISKLCASISMFVSFDIGVSLLGTAWAAVAPTRYWTQIAVCTGYCQYCQCCALAAHWLRTGSSTGRSRRSGAQTSRVRLLVLAAGPSGAALG